MSAFFGTLLANWWPQILAGLGALAAAFGIHRKAQIDERRKVETEDLRNANEIRRDGAAARARSAADSDAGGLRQDDGFKRK